MVQICCVPTCKSKTLKNSKISFHRFPKNREMTLRWLSAVHLTETNLIENKDLRVCSLHFCLTDYIVGGNLRKLKKESVPKVKVKLGGKENLTYLNIRQKLTTFDTEFSDSFEDPVRDELSKLKIEMEQLVEENALLKQDVEEKAAKIEKQEVRISILQTELESLRKRKFSK